MNELTYETLRKRVSDELNAQAKEFGRTVEEIERNFRYLGLGKAVWHPEMIHSTNIGGLEAESYIGYSRIEGKWGLSIRTIERDHETRCFVSQRVYPLVSCGNVEIVVSALKKVPELMRFINQSVEEQMKALAGAGNEYDRLRNPDCNF